jgi:hypothetical protein
MKRSTLTTASSRSRGGDQHRLVVDVDVGLRSPTVAMRCASFWKRLASAWISRGKVAENNSVRRVAGVFSSSSSMSSRKPEVEHLVGLVEHHRLDLGERHVAAVDVIAQAARRADDDVRALVQEVRLAPRIHAADAARCARPVGA